MSDRPSSNQARKRPFAEPAWAEVAIALLEPGKRNRRGDGLVSVCIDFSAHRPLGRVRPRCRDGGLTRCPLAIAAVAGKEGHDA
jgi:hypothetical protein